MAGEVHRMLTRQERMSLPQADELDEDNPCTTTVDIMTHGLRNWSQSQADADFTVVEHPERGKCVVTRRAFKQGSFVLEYEGEIITEELKKIRKQKYKKQNKGSYIVDVTWNNKSCALDGTMKTGTYGRLVNHSRGPNLKYLHLLPVEPGTQPRMPFFAAEDIPEGEELFWDYGLDDGETDWATFRRPKNIRKPMVTESCSPQILSASPPTSCVPSTEMRDLPAVPVLMDSKVEGTPTLLSFVTLPHIDDLEKFVLGRQVMCAEQHRYLQELQSYHQYLWESDDFQQWIREHMLACSDEFGRDYEHIAIIQEKLDELKMAVEAQSNRFTQCEDMAMELVTGNSRFATDILNRQRHLRCEWHELGEALLELHDDLSALKIYRFNQDVEEALLNIQDKYSAIPEDIGRDIVEVTNYQDKHEAFQNEMITLEAKLQVLVDEALCLQEQCSDDDAEKIRQQQVLVIENWASLEAHSGKRASALKDLYNFHASMCSYCPQTLSSECQEQHMEDCGLLCTTLVSDKTPERKMSSKGKRKQVKHQRIKKNAKRKHLVNKNQQKTLKQKASLAMPNAPVDNDGKLKRTFNAAQMEKRRQRAQQQRDEDEENGTKKEKKRLDNQKQQLRLKKLALSMLSHAPAVINGKPKRIFSPEQMEKRRLRALRQGEEKRLLKQKQQNSQ